MKKVLFVTKDMGAAKPAIPTAEECQRRGHTIIVMAEGLSVPLWKKAGFELLFEGVEKPEDRGLSQAEVLLDECRPDIVVMTQSNPCFLENNVGRAANARGLPLVSLTDFWGGHRRSVANPDMVVTLDEYAAELAIADHPASKIVIAGNPSITLIEPPTSVLQSVLARRNYFGQVFLFVGGSPEATIAEIRLLGDCLRKTRQSWTLIPRFHPKYAGEKVGGRPYLNICRDILAEHDTGSEQIADIAAAQNSDQLAALCDVTFSGFSLSQHAALNNGRNAVSLWTVESEAALMKQVGLNRSPLVSLGCATLVNSPRSLANLLQPEPNNRAKLKPYDASLAVDAIEGAFLK